MINIKQEGRTEFLNFPNRIQIKLDIQPIQGIIGIILILCWLIFNWNLNWFGPLLIGLLIMGLMIDIKIFNK